MTSIYDIIEPQEPQTDDSTQSDSQTETPRSPLLTSDDVDIDSNLEFMDGVNLLAIIARFL